MKKSYLIVISCMSPLAARAQPDLGLAIKGGPNAATLSENYRVNRYGFSGGLAAKLQWRLSNRFSLAGQTELLYTPRGADVIFDGDYVGGSRQHYVDVVLAARPEARLGPLSVYGLLGGSLDLLADAIADDYMGRKDDISYGLRRIDVALLVGAGAAFRLPRRELGPFRLDTFFFEGRYDRGFINTDPVTEGFKNRTMSLMVGLSFDLAPRASAPPPASRSAASARRLPRRSAARPTRAS